jgi:cation diffusion facilitator family transporter
MNAEHLSSRIRLRVAILSIVMGSLILGIKYYAFVVSGSTALKSDAIENVVNVVAAVFALGAIIFANKPADRDHPYGHGKIEHFSAAFEGGLISLAAVLIAWEAINAMWHGPELKDLGRGLVINLIAGAMNGLLGLFLLMMGRKLRSHAIEADGHHVLSDFWTTIGIAIGLLLVTFTGIRWLDPVMALGVSVLLAFTGFKLVRSSSQALLDMEDPEVLAKLIEVINRTRPVDIITIHELRTMRSGRYTHVDIHMVVPEFHPLSTAHDLADAFEKLIITEAGLEGEMHTHIDPCQQAWCNRCGVANCPIRLEPQTGQPIINVETATEPGTI